MPKYIIRFDDITPNMNWDNFLKVKNITEKYHISSVLGVVPENRDPKLSITTGLSETDFFNRIKKYADYGDTIAQHGTYHVYTTQNPGLLGINDKSEFAGLSYEEQLEKLKVGKSILEKNRVWQPYFMAPSHSFDFNTLKALKTLGFEAITDGYGFYPYHIEGITLVPQLVSRPLKYIPCGIQTICLHTNSMNDRDIKKLTEFLESNHVYFIDFKKVINIKPKFGSINSLTYYSSKRLLILLRKGKKLFDKKVIHIT